MKRRAFLLTAGALALGCGGDDGAAGAGAGAGVASGAPPGAPSFVADPPGPGPAIDVTSRSSSADVLVLTLTGREVPGVFGVSLRMTHPAGLALEALEPSTVWPADAIVVARPSGPGESIVTIAPRGAGFGLPAGDVELGILRFRVVGEAPGSFSFVAARSEILSPVGFSRRDVALRGGSIR